MSGGHGKGTRKGTPEPKAMALDGPRARVGGKRIRHSGKGVGAAYYYVTGELIADASAVDDVLAALRRVDIDKCPTRPIGKTGLVGIEIDARKRVDQIVNLLSGPLAVEPNHVLTSHFHLGGLAVLRPKAVDPAKIATRPLKGRGEHVTIGVVDSFFYDPVAAGHPSWAIDGVDFDVVGPVPSEHRPHNVTIGHGNAVVGIIKQLAPEATVITSTIETVAGDVPGAMSDTSVAAAIERLLSEHRVHILVLPLGGSTRSGAMPAIARALDPYLDSTVVIASAGNSGDDPTVYPALDPDIVGVSAWKPSAMELSYARGAAKVVLPPYAGLPKLALAPWANSGVCAQLAAPGVRVPAPFLTGRYAIEGGEKNTGAFIAQQEFKGWALFTGTSFAAPIAAGVAAGAVGGSIPSHGEILDALF
jgi:Subtilase family